MKKVWSVAFPCTCMDIGMWLSTFHEPQNRVIVLSSLLYLTCRKQPMVSKNIPVSDEVASFPLVSCCSLLLCTFLSILTSFKTKSKMSLI